MLYTVSYFIFVMVLKNVLTLAICKRQSFLEWKKRLAYIMSYQVEGYRAVINSPSEEIYSYSDYQTIFGESSVWQLFAAAGPHWWSLVRSQWNDVSEIDISIHWFSEKTGSGSASCISTLSCGTECLGHHVYSMSGKSHKSFILLQFESDRWYIVW